MSVWLGKNCECGIKALQPQSAQPFHATYSDALCELIVTVMLKLLMTCPRQGSRSVRQVVPHTYRVESGVSADDGHGR